MERLTKLVTTRVSNSTLKWLQSMASKKDWTISHTVNRILTEQQKANGKPRISRKKGKQDD